MWVTLIVDASFCHDTGKVGYAYWISSGRKKGGGDGTIGDPVVSSVGAEMHGILRAVQRGFKDGLIQPHDNLLCQTDCVPAISAFTGRRRNLGTEELWLVAEFRQITQEHNLFSRFKHVKGHQNSKEARYVVNNICDRKAKNNMRKARDKILARRKKEKL